MILQTLMYCTCAFTVATVTAPPVTETKIKKETKCE